jgi:arabinoxylan arabinofuranohydrolase
MNTPTGSHPRKLGIVGSLFCLVMTFSSASLADNPIVQTIYTADPAPMVYDGRVYVYSGHDEDVLVNDFFTMNEWRVYSSSDMVN